jgi:hypothetical protein
VHRCEHAIDRHRDLSQHAAHVQHLGADDQRDTSGLNGVLAPAGDRASQIGSPYQVTFQVTTNAEDGQQVKLTFNNAATPGATTMLTAPVSGGSATFGLPLTPDGTYQVIATCTNAANVSGSSQLTSYPVDTTAPNLTVTQPVDGSPSCPAISMPGPIQRLRQDDLHRRGRIAGVARRRRQ